MANNIDSVMKKYRYFGRVRIETIAEIAVSNRFEQWGFMVRLMGRFIVWIYVTESALSG